MNYFLCLLAQPLFPIEINEPAVCPLFEIEINRAASVSDSPEKLLQLSGCEASSAFWACATKEGEILPFYQKKYKISIIYPERMWGHIVVVGGGMLGLIFP